jgi:integrase
MSLPGALWLLLLTGIRRNEILAAKRADVDWDNKTLFIGKTKNGEPVLTPLSRAAIARLKLIPKLKDNPYIICGAIPGKPLPIWMRCGDGSERKLDFTT